MKKLLLATSLISLLSGSLFAEGLCKINKDTGEPMVCVSKDQACVVLAALNCFGSRIARNDAPVEGDDEFPPADNDVAELRDIVADLKEQIAQCCKDNGGCEDIDNKVCKLVK